MSARKGASHQYFPAMLPSTQNKARNQIKQNNAKPIRFMQAAGASSVKRARSWLRVECAKVRRQ